MVMSSPAIVNLAGMPISTRSVKEKTAASVPTQGLGSTLGKRGGNWEDSQEEATGANNCNKKKKGGKVTPSAMTKEDDTGTTEGKEATSPGAAGQLTGAHDSACQKP